MDSVEDLGGELIGTQPRIAIIGGGYAGVAAAVKLAELGHESIIFEAGKVLGGRARRIDYRGTVLDNGQHILSGAYTECTAISYLETFNASASAVVAQLAALMEMN